jgi:glycosyltransferase involved in cell wall biosynthesis
MKILVLQDFLRSGGTERQSILLANAFATAGHETTLLTFRPDGPLEHTVRPEVLRRALQPFDLKLDWFAPGLSAALRQLAPEVILCMGRMANCYGGNLQLEFPATPVVATMRTGKALPALFVRSLSLVRHVVANSHDARDTLLHDYAVPARNVSVIHNSLVFPETSAAASLSDREELRARHDASPSTTVLLCVAMFRPEKNQRGLIETLAQLPPQTDWQLWLVGEGAAQAACRRLVDGSQLGSRVKFLGFHRDPSPLYHAADIAVHASESDALSNFIVEAQAHGLPAVVYEGQGMAECFIEGETGWIIRRDDDTAFRKTVLRLAEESAVARARRSGAARSYARAAFDPARQVAAYLALFQRLLSPPVT